MSDLTESQRNFEAWFGTVLAKLMHDRDAGFVVVMVAFPLLERYLTQRSGRKANTDQFNKALLTVFPELKTEQNANLFWSIYRHGLLHNVALSRESHGLSHDKPIVEMALDGRVWMHPNLFAERVLNTIRADFATFEKGVPLPTVSPIYGKAPEHNHYSAYQGTWMPPKGEGK